MNTRSLFRLPMRRKLRQASAEAPREGLGTRASSPAPAGPVARVRTSVREQAKRAKASSDYWSSTTYANNPNNAWNVNFNDGNVNNNDKNNALYVRAVRGGS